MKHSIKPIAALLVCSCCLTLFAEDVADTLNRAIMWGESKDGIQVGLLLPPKSNNQCIVYLRNTNSTTKYGLWSAKDGFRLELALFDGENKLFPKTGKGRALCKGIPGSSNKDRNSNVVFFLSPNVPRQYNSAFSVAESFNIKSNGVYRLKIKAMIIQDEKGTNSILSFVVESLVNLDVQ